MYSVWKFPLLTADVWHIEMPRNAKILSIQMQGSRPCIWALVNTSSELREERTFLTFGTGHTIKQQRDNLEYVGTYQIPEKALVFHVFEYLPDRG